MFGLNPSSPIVISIGASVTAWLPVFGHDYICLSSDIWSNVLSATCGECLETTDLLSIIPTPNDPAQLEVYTPTTDGGKTETSTNIIDLIEFHFTDKYGNDVLSLEDFILTIVVDQVKKKELLASDHISLFNVQKQKANTSRELILANMNKKN